MDGFSYTINYNLYRYYHVFKHALYIITIFILLPIPVRGQYDPAFSNYWAMEPFFNPGSVGKNSKINFVAAYALDFAGFEHNPRTMYVGADMPVHLINDYSGVGISFMNDQIGLFTHKKVALQYAYKHKLFGGTISYGLQLGMLSETFDGSGLDLNEQSDPAFSTSSINGNKIDVSIGLYYLNKDWYGGLSVQHANAPLIKMGETNELQIDRTYYMTCGYNIKLRNPFVTIQPSLLERTDGKAYRTDITGRLVYTNEEKVMYAGVSYSPSNSATVLIGGSFHGINLGYSYEIYTSALSIGNGSHELVLSYQTEINLGKKGKNKHKSVRIL